MQTIDQQEVARHTAYGSLIESLAQGLLEPIESPPRGHFNPNHDASSVLVMSAWKPRGVMGVKIVAIWPENNAKGKPAVSGTYVLLSCEDGTTLAVMDGTELTLRRTAAVAALGAKKLARPTSQRLAVLGTGALSTHLALAHHSVFSLTETVIWGRHLDKAQAVVAELAKQGVAAVASTDLQATLAATDIAVAATTATTPFISSDWVQPGTHLGLVGAFTADMSEAEPQLMTKARIFVDTREGVMQKGGEVLQALRAGLITESDICGELKDLLAPSTPATGGLSDQEITIFKTVGFASQDLVAAEHVMRSRAQVTG
ncbi:hypothetical protein [Rhodoferax sp. PAMC 29310]|uniref:hypothetical protein n=1 Tax=Rhodoferax sp. PAMC 29310 TaxID=2822760 RepID=UPI001B334F19|nr:hypothetical protein [Rhodoferax sp. PAMC 29310]